MDDVKCHGGSCTESSSKRVKYGGDCCPWRNKSGPVSAKIAVPLVDPDAAVDCGYFYRLVKIGTRKITTAKIGDGKDCWLKKTEQCTDDTITYCKDAQGNIIT
jgi:hypothetical protein